LLESVCGINLGLSQQSVMFTSMVQAFPFQPFLQLQPYALHAVRHFRSSFSQFCFCTFVELTGIRQFRGTADGRYRIVSLELSTVLYTDEKAAVFKTSD